MIDIAHHIPKNSTLIVGFSGGPDSTCLLKLLTNLQSSHNITLIAAHLDHQWRKESEQDAAWCKEFVKKLNKNITFEHATASKYAKNIKYNGSKEEVARIMRRTFFQQLAIQYQAQAIVLAHHQDDQLETFFIRLIRGSSTTGIAGMKQCDGLYLRPLLNISKETILQFLNDQSIPFLTDQTNQNTDFLRNKIRHQLITQLNTIDPRFATNTLRCMQHLQETNDLLDQITTQTIRTMQNNQNQYCVDTFLKINAVLQQRIIMQLLIVSHVQCTPTEKFLQEIIRFLSKKQSAKAHQITKATILIKEKNYFYFKSL